MLQFHLSKILSNDMKTHITDPYEIIPGVMQWYGHRVTVMHRKCVLMMEYKSRYCIVFAGLTKPDFTNFPELFRGRLWREVVSIRELDNLQSENLVSLVNRLTEQQQYQTGSDRSVQAHFGQVAYEFGITVNRTNRLPMPGEEQFGCGVRLNEMLRKIGGDKDYFTPLTVFRDSWLEMLYSSQRNNQ